MNVFDHIELDLYLVCMCVSLSYIDFFIFFFLRVIVYIIYHAFFFCF